MSLYEDALRFKGKRVLVVGDVMLDKYVSSVVKRLNPEKKPAPLYEDLRAEHALGGAANVARDISALGGKVYLCGVVGNRVTRNSVFGDFSWLLYELLDEARVQRFGFLVDTKRPGTIKARWLAPEDSHYGFRTDEERSQEIDSEVSKRLLEYVGSVISQVDVVTFSDYAKGVFVRDVAGSILSMAKAAGKKVIVAPKTVNWWKFSGSQIVVPNNDEARGITKIMNGDLSEVAIGVCKEMACHDVVVTNGKEGMLVYSPHKNIPLYHARTQPRDNANVVGAGDLVLSVLSLGTAAGIDLNKCADMANVATGVAVTKPGTIWVSLDELLEELERQNL